MSGALGLKTRPIPTERRHSVPEIMEALEEQLRLAQEMFMDEENGVESHNENSSCGNESLNSSCYYFDASSKTTKTYEKKWIEIDCKEAPCYSDEATKAYPYTESEEIYCAEGFLCSVAHSSLISSDQSNHDSFFSAPEISTEIDFKVPIPYEIQILPSDKFKTDINSKECNENELSDELYQCELMDKFDPCELLYTFDPCKYIAKFDSEYQNGNHSASLANIHKMSNSTNDSSDDLNMAEEIPSVDHYTDSSHQSEILHFEECNGNELSDEFDRNKPLHQTDHHEPFDNIDQYERHNGNDDNNNNHRAFSENIFKRSSSGIHSQISITNSEIPSADLTSNNHRISSSHRKPSLASTDDYYFSNSTQSCTLRGIPDAVNVYPTNCDTSSPHIDDCQSGLSHLIQLSNKSKKTDNFSIVFLFFIINAVAFILMHLLSLSYTNTPRIFSTIRREIEVLQFKDYEKLNGSSGGTNIFGDRIVKSCPSSMMFVNSEVLNFTSSPGFLEHCPIQEINFDVSSQTKINVCLLHFITMIVPYNIGFLGNPDCALLRDFGKARYDSRRDIVGSTCYIPFLNQEGQVRFTSHLRDDIFKIEWNVCSATFVGSNHEKSVTTETDEKSVTTETAALRKRTASVFQGL